jgi:hypothetical protein
MGGSAVVAKDKEGKMGAAQKEAHWTGTIVRSDKDGGTLTVRKDGSATEKIVHFDADTKWTKQEKGKIESIDPGQVKDGDRVICVGSYNEKGEFHATRIDQRLHR